MKMFPHSFVPFLKPHTRVQATETSTHGKPTGIDVETVTDLLMSARKVSGVEMRKECQMEVIKRLPEAAVDWNTVDWIQLVPFKTRRV